MAMRSMHIFCIGADGRDIDDCGPRTSAALMTGTAHDMTVALEREALTTGAQHDREAPARSLAAVVT